MKLVVLVICGGIIWFGGVMYGSMSSEYLVGDEPSLVTKSAASTLTGCDD